MNTGELVKQKLKESGIKQSWLAKQLGITDSTLSSMLKTDLKSAILGDICNILKIPINDIYESYLNNKKDTDHSAKTESVSHKNNTI